ncbi:MAG: DUF6867 family protein [Xanthobacteraceae bacterium]
MAAFYEQQSALPFLLVTIVLGGGAAWLSGRAIALTWRPWWMVLLAAFALGLAVRFFHHTLFDGTLLSLHYFAVDMFILALLALAGFRLTRSRQMAGPYGFLSRK